MDKPERYMTLVIISFLLFLSLAVLSNYQGLSMLIYGSYACLALVFLFFLASLRSMGQRDLFDVLGSLASKTKGGVSRKGKASKEPAQKQSKSKPVKPAGSMAEQEPSLYQVTYEKLPIPMPPPPPPNPEGEEPLETTCPMCGQKLHPLAAFCGRCGHKLREPDADTA